MKVTAILVFLSLAAIALAKPAPEPHLEEIVKHVFEPINGAVIKIAGTVDSVIEAVFEGLFGHHDHHEHRRPCDKKSSESGDKSSESGDSSRTSAEARTSGETNERSSSESNEATEGSKITLAD